MPFWNGSEIPCTSALAMPTLFLKSARKCPHVHPAQPLIRGSSNANHSLWGQGCLATPKEGSLGISSGSKRAALGILESYPSLWSFCRPSLHYQNLLHTDALHTTYLRPSPFFFKIPLQFLIRCAAGQILWAYPPQFTSPLNLLR